MYSHTRSPYLYAFSLNSSAHGQTRPRIRFALVQIWSILVSEKLQKCEHTEQYKKLSPIQSATKHLEEQRQKLFFKDYLYYAKSELCLLM
jgi:hypothetical protein